MKNCLKFSCLLKKALIFLALLILAMQFFACGSADMAGIIKKGEPQIEEMVICKNVDSDFAPLEPVSVFPAGTSSVYLSVKFKNLTPDNHIKVTWHYKSLQQQLASQEFVPEVTGSGYYSFNIKINGSFPPGNYNAEVYFDSQLIKSQDFTIE